MRFARVGGLSPVKYKKGGPRPEGKGNWNPNSFHAPPEKKGIYAFIWPHIELFLVCWSADNRRELEQEGLRKFEYEGYLWAHIGNSALEKGAWVYIHTGDLEREIKKENHSAIKQVHRTECKDWKTPFIPRTKGFSQGFCISKDHLEVFIPKRFLGKIR